MSQRESDHRNDLLARRELLRKAGGFSVIASIAMLGLTALSGCGLFDEYSDTYANMGDYDDAGYSDFYADSYSNYPDDAPDTGFYGNAFA